MEEGHFGVASPGIPRSHAAEPLPSPDPRQPDSRIQVHTLLGSAQPGRTLRAWSLNVPSAASERPSAPSRRSPLFLPCTEVLAKEHQLVTEACCVLACQAPPPAWPPPPRPWRLPLQPGVRNHLPA